MTGLVTIAPRTHETADVPAPAASRWQNDGSVEITDLWRILWHRKLLVLGTALLLTLATLIYGLLTPSLYVATAQILIDPRDRQVVSNDVNPTSISPDGGVTQVESQASVIQSVGVLMRAIKATDLTADPEFNGKSRLGDILDLFRSKTDTDSQQQRLTNTEAKTLNALRRRLAVKRADKVLVVDVVVTAENADKAARLANAVADAYLVDQAESRSQGAREASEALTARLAEQRKRVQAAENAVERYRADNNLTAASGRLISEQQLTEISNQLSAAQARSSTLKAQVDQIAQQRRGGGPAGSTAEAMQSAVVSKLREQEGALVQREADLQSQLGPLHPSIAAARSQLTNVRQLISVELDRIERAARADYDRAQSNERQLATRLATLTKQTQTSDQASVRLRDLQRDLDAVRAIYSTYLLRAQETREQSGVDSTNARIISRAQPPQQRNWPPLGLLLAGALGGGLGLGAGIALVREYASPMILSGNQVQSLINAPVIGILPQESPAAMRASGKAGGKADGEAAPKPDAGKAAGGSAKDRPAKADIARIKADAKAEGVAGLALLRMFDMDGPGKTSTAARSVLLISTPEDAHERLRTALLLADVAAMRGERVLLIDANVEDNQETSVAGVLDVLRGDCALDAAIHYESRRDVALMAKGRQKPTAQKVSGRAFAHRMLVEAGKHFDLVVIDGGTLTRNIKISPLVVTAEQVVLVARLGATEQQAVRQTVEVTAIMGRDITGAILVDTLGRA